MKDTKIWQLKDLLKWASDTQCQIEGAWVPARPLGYSSITYRFHAAWKVFTGKADAVIWPLGQ